MPDDLLTRLNTELAPSEQVMERVLSRVVDEISHDVAVSPPTSRRGRRRLPTIRIGLAVAGAVVAGIVVALSPFEPTADRRAVPGPAAAQAALERAGVAAGQVDWTPLGAGEYHHTMTAAIDLELPRHAMDPPHVHEDRVPGNASANETFLDRDGRGIEISTMGGTGDPDVIPFMSKGGGFGFRGDGVAENTPVGSVDEQLRYAFAVTVRAWPRDGRPTNSTWVRQEQGFVQGTEYAGGAIAKAGLSLGQRFQRDFWGMPIDTVDALNAARADQLETMLDEVLAPMPDGELAVSGPLAGVDAYEQTREWFQAQVEAHNAVKLLAKAPLAPHVRAAIFRRLARSEHVTLDRDATDRSGRQGTRITFEWIIDESVDAFSVTKVDLRADARAKQQPSDGPIAGPETVRVPAHRSTGRWYQSIIVDETDGSILQNEEWVDWKTTASIPRVATTTARVPRGTGWNLAVRSEPGWYGTGGGELFLVRDRATSLDTARSPACEITPRMCR